LRRFSDKGGTGELGPGVNRLFSRGWPIRHPEWHQLAQAFNTLLAARQNVGKMQAGADRQRSFADALQGFPALVGNDQQLADRHRRR
jgi:hypothetical protein